MEKGHFKIFFVISVTFMWILSSLCNLSKMEHYHFWIFWYRKDSWHIQPHGIQKNYVFRLVSTHMLRASSGTKNGLFSPLIHPAWTVCDDENLQKGIQHLKQTLKKNGYSSWFIQQAFDTKNKPWTETEKPAGVALLPYQHSTSSKIRCFWLNIISKQFLIWWRKPSTP